MRLFIAEKPKMGEDIAKNIGDGKFVRKDGYLEINGDIVTWCVGHLLSLCDPEAYDEKYKQWKIEDLPIFPQKWKHEISFGKGKQVNVIKALIPKATEIINAGDPGREGQLIVDELLVFLNNKKPVKRILLQSLDTKTVKKALNNLTNNEDYKNVYLAGLARAQCDWLVGMNTTRAYTLIGQKAGYQGVLSVGRVQSPTLKIVVDRDLEIENFQPKDYFTFNATFKKNNDSFSGKWVRDIKKTYDFFDEDGRIIKDTYINNVAKNILNKNGIIKQVETKDGSEQAPLPFSLSGMQVYASAKWGYTAKEVLDTCQSLYEKKATSYPRTDCRYLPENLHAEANEVLNAIKKCLPSYASTINGADITLKHKCFNDKELSDHHAIIPTSEAPDISTLTAMERNIYEAAAKRFIGIFYPECTFEKTTITVEIETELFKTYGKVIINPGFKAVFQTEALPEDTTDEEDNEQQLPPVKEGDVVLCSNTKIEKKQTTPPSRFNDGTLIQAMTDIHTLVKDPEVKKKLKELKGIGREATRNVIIETLVKRGFITREKKNLISTPIGRALIKALNGKITDPTITALWENALDNISQGKVTFEAFMSKQHDWVNKLLDESSKVDVTVFNNLKSLQPAKSSTPYKKPAYNNNKASTSTSATKAPPKPSTGSPKCPKCGSPMLERVAKATNSKFLGCSGFPKCKHTEFPKK